MLRNSFRTHGLKFVPGVALTNLDVKQVGSLQTMQETPTLLRWSRSLHTRLIRTTVVLKLQPILKLQQSCNVKYPELCSPILQTVEQSPQYCHVTIKVT